MSITVIHSIKVKKARRNYYCNACLFMQENLSEIGTGKLTFAERREIVKARNEKYLILKGQPYQRQFNTDGGDTWTFRCREAINEICLKYELYPEN